MDNLKKDKPMNIYKGDVVVTMEGEFTEVK
jgi:hypothetical protein